MQVQSIPHDIYFDQIMMIQKGWEKQLPISLKVESTKQMIRKKNLRKWSFVRKIAIYVLIYLYAELVQSLPSLYYPDAIIISNIFVKFETTRLLHSLVYQLSSNLNIYLIFRFTRKTGSNKQNECNYFQNSHTLIKPIIQYNFQITH